MVLVARPWAALRCERIFGRDSRKYPEYPAAAPAILRPPRNISRASWEGVPHHWMGGSDDGVWRCAGPDSWSQNLVRMNCSQPPTHTPLPPLSSPAASSPHHSRPIGILPLPPCSPSPLTTRRKEVVQNVSAQGRHSYWGSTEDVAG